VLQADRATVASGALGRLVRRVTMGATADELSRAASLGYTGYLDYQLDYARIDDSEAEAFVAKTWPAIAKPTREIYAIPQPEIIAIVQQATLYRAVASRRQLFERMVEFWTDHFNVGIEKIGVNKVEDDREVIRRHALDTFPALVKASSHSVSMLGYLDQFDSRAGAPNQNYARELMELHTLGVDGGYTQADVLDLSRVLTGWTFERQWTGKGFIFDQAIHDVGAKRVLGVAIAASEPGPGGVAEGDRLIDLLCTHPSTARFIARKLLSRFLTPSPSAAQVESVAAVYLSTGGDIKAMIRATLRQDWLEAAPLKLKRPLHLVVSALRVLGPRITGMATVNDVVIGAGQALFQWNDPDGYPDALDFWDGDFLSRWRAMNQLLFESAGSDVKTDVAEYVAAGSDGTIERIASRVFGGDLPDSTRAALARYAQAAPWTETRARETLALALSSPAFQWH
jgi:uncharacterized protein (DUF1800 family)